MHNTFKDTFKSWVEKIERKEFDPGDVKVAAPGEMIDNVMDGSKIKVLYDRAPGSVCSDVLPIKVKHVIWTRSTSLAYTYDYTWFLLLAEDGRYVATTYGVTGTCSYCGFTIYNVMVADTLEAAIMFGFCDLAREAMGFNED